jgi:hypothetical protein
MQIKSMKNAKYMVKYACKYTNIQQKAGNNKKTTATNISSHSSVNPV